MSSATNNVPREFSQFLTASISVRVRVSQIYCPPQFSLVWYFYGLYRLLCFSWTKWRVDFLWKDRKENEQISVPNGTVMACCSVPTTVHLRDGRKLVSKRSGKKDSRESSIGNQHRTVTRRQKLVPFDVGTRTFHAYKTRELGTSYT